MPFGIIMSLVVCTVLYIVLSVGDDRASRPGSKLGTAEPMITALSLADGPPASSRSRGSSSPSAPSSR